MAPTLDDHVTAESILPAPSTVALHCELAPGATVAGEQETATEEICEETGWDGADAGDLLPPHPAHTSTPAEARKSITAEQTEYLDLDGMCMQ